MTTRSGHAAKEATTYKLGESLLVQTKIAITFVSSDTIGLSYDSMPNNRPNTYGNYIALWQNQNQIPWDTDPLQKQAISGDTQKGSMVFQGLQVDKNDYILGYSVGPARTESQKSGNVCSTAFVPLGTENQDFKYFFSAMSLKNVGPNSVIVQFNLPPGARAATNKAWMGLWRGESASYNNPPDYAVPITIDSNVGTVGFNNVHIGIDLTYTLGLYPSGWNTDPSARNQKVLACSLTFTND